MLSSSFHLTFQAVKGMALNGLFSSSIFTNDHQTAVSPIPRTTTRTKSPILFTIFTSHPSPSCCSCSSPNPINCAQKPISPNDKIQPIGETRKFPVNLSKRMLNFSILTVILSTHLPKVIAAEEKLELERYTDSKEGFTLLKPSSWIKVDKAGANALFEEPSKGANNVGVVVTPVRLTKLGEFGDPHFVADKLIQAEKRKESTKDAEVISVLERSGEGGLQVYEFEYKLDSTRGGMKRIFSAAFVASKKLYLLNIAHSDKPESPLDTERRLMLEQVLHSFDAAPST